MGVADNLAQKIRRSGRSILRRLKRAAVGGDGPRSPGRPFSAFVDIDQRPGRPFVLVVDDNPVNLMMISQMLSYWGISPLLAADGAEAVALARELQPDLILMDLQMPVLDGFGASRQIRRFEVDHFFARVPIVAYTSSPDIGSQRLRDCGIDGVLAKPCDAKSLHECLIRWCPPRGASFSADTPGRRGTAVDDDVRSGNTRPIHPGSATKPA